MPTTSPKPITGRQCTLTIGSTDYSNVIQSFTLKPETERLSYAVSGRNGTLSANGPTTWTLSITFANDITDPSGLIQALWTAAASDSTLDFVGDWSGQTVSGTVVAQYPELTADASSIAGASIDLEVTGDVTGITPASAKPAAAGK